MQEAEQSCVITVKRMVLMIFSGYVKHGAM